jgi:hypothetical protein
MFSYIYIFFFLPPSFGYTHCAFHTPAVLIPHCAFLLIRPLRVSPLHTKTPPSPATGPEAGAWVIIMLAGFVPLVFVLVSER